MTRVTTSSPLTEAEQAALVAAIRLNTRISSVISAVVGGVSLWLATAILLWKGGVNVGQTLAILATFFPGYHVSWTGAWVGLFWGALYGAVSGWIMYAAYATTLRRKIERELGVASGAGSLRTPTFVLSGNALGVSLGVTIALQLLVLTNWLIIRGTADQSVHAALVGILLPGYSVSFLGSLIGAGELFVVTYVCASFVAYLYNRLARRRRAIDL